jgi:hypothetical protein
MNTILGTNNGTPLSIYIKQKLRPFFTELITQDLEYENYFDLFEYTLSLSYMCQRIEHSDLDWAPVGSYVWNSYSGRRKKSSLIQNFIAQAESQDKYFLPLKSGMFGGSIEKFLEAKKRLDALINRNY